MDKDTACTTLLSQGADLQSRKAALESELAQVRAEEAKAGISMLSTSTNATSGPTTSTSATTTGTTSKRTYKRKTETKASTPKKSKSDKTAAAAAAAAGSSTSNEVDADEPQSVDLTSPSDNEDDDNGAQSLGSSDKGNDQWHVVCEPVDSQDLSYFTDKDKLIVTYKHSKKFYIPSDQFIGDIKVYPSTLADGSPCLYIKKSKIMEQMRKDISKLLKKPVKFYGKNEQSLLLGCYICTQKDVDNNKCVNAKINGKPTLLPFSELFDNKVGKLSALLQSGTVKKVKNELYWSLSIHEIRLDDIPAGEVGYFRRSEPNLIYF